MSLDGPSLALVVCSIMRQTTNDFSEDTELGIVAQSPTEELSTVESCRLWLSTNSRGITSTGLERASEPLRRIIHLEDFSAR